MKKSISLLLCLLICMSFLPTFAFAANRDLSLHESIASDLKALNLFKGVSETDFDLDRAPTRLEALIMLIRVLGKEKEALSGNWSHPFKDVPQWADKYVGYAYTNKLTNGVSATEFGSRNANCAMYLTFVLRALGYSDANGKDFTWDNPYDKATYCGILPPGVDIKNFLRADVALVSHAALECSVNGEYLVTLSEKLIREGVFTAEQYNANYDMFKHKVPADRYAAFDTLRMFVVENGEFIEEEIYGVNLDSYMLHFVNEENGTEFNIEYIIPTATLRIEQKRYQSNESYFDVSVLLNSQDALSDRITIFGNLVDGNEKLSGMGAVDPTTFEHDTPITFTLWPKDQYSTYYTKADCEEATRIMLADMLDILQSICKTFNVPITVADLGFESIF
ncbi:MAG: hypothetical protein IJE70_04150 [Oscillospiraceae bacterium]|nr:hypothetical protein [Oscillospiraceae bacterium]